MIINGIDCPNFKLHEFRCKCGCGLANPNPRLLERLNDLREVAGIPLHITSGSRCLEHNRSIGSKDTSSHVPKGESGYTDAVDIRTESSTERFKVMDAAMKIGFRRIGFGKGFIHVDVDLFKADNVMWDYY